MKYLSGLLLTFVMGVVSFQLAELEFCKEYQLSL